jgi:hypothetical protein
MADLVQFPFNRNQYPGIDNPLYISDIVAANQEVLTGLAAIAGLGATDFAIFAGLQYIVSVSGSNYYTPGIFYLNGVWYFQPDVFDEDNYLEPDVTGIMDYTFEDATIRPEYNVNYSQYTGSSGPATSPIFSGNMSSYRMDLKTLLSEIEILQLATILDVIVVAVLPASYTVDFINDKSIFFESATVNTTIHFDMTGAVPGTVITLKWTFASSLTLSIPPTTGQTILLESGDQTNVGTNINILTMLYAGINDVGNPEIRIVLSQPTSPT